MVRRGSGIADMTDPLIHDGMRHRICISWVDAIVRGGVYCVSLWFRDSEGMSQANMALLDELAEVTHVAIDLLFALVEASQTSQVFRYSFFSSSLTFLICFCIASN